MDDIMEKKFKDIKIMVIGDFMLDRYIFGSATRISPEAPVPIIKRERTKYNPGGGGNILMNLASLGAKVLPVGIIGADRHGQNLLNLLKKQKAVISAKGIFCINTRPTTIKTRIVAGNQQLCRIDLEETSEINNREQSMILSFIEKNLKNINGIILADYRKGLLGYELTRRIIELSMTNNVFISALSTICIRGFLNKFKGVNILKTNWPALRAFLGQSNISTNDIHKINLDLDIKNLIITKGSKGIVLSEIKRNVITIPGTPREVFDISGAGDTVISVATLCFLSGYSMINAAKIANVAARKIIKELGTVPIELNDIKEVLIELSN